MEVSFNEFISNLPSEKDNDIRPVIKQATLLYMSSQIGNEETRAQSLLQDVWKKGIVSKKLPANRPTSNGRARGGGDSDYYTNIIYGWAKADISKRGDKKLAWAVFYYFFRYVNDASYFIEIARRTWPENSPTFQRFVYAKSGGTESDSFQKISERVHAPAEEVRREIGRYWNVRAPHPGLQPPHYLSKEAVANLLAKNPFDSVWLSPHNHHSIPLVGRAEELRRLDAFIASDNLFSVCPLIAPSGAGKTRLISEWMKSFVTGGRANEWDAGFAMSRDPSIWSEEKWVIERNTLIVIDYTFAYNEVVEQIARRTLRQLSTQTLFKIRLLVIDHILPKKLFDDLFWSKMFGRKDEQDFARAELITEPIELAAQSSNSAMLASVIACSASLSGKIHRTNDPVVVAAADHLFKMGDRQSGGNEAVCHPLFAALMGHAIRKSGSDNLDFGAWTRRDLIDRYFTGPLRFPWTVWNSATNKKAGILAGALVSAATLRRGISTHQIRSLVGKDADAVIQYAGRCISSEDQDFLQPLLPDILGEAFVIEFLKAVRNEPERDHFIKILEYTRDIEEQREASTNVHEAFTRLARNLANLADDPVWNDWDTIRDFLNPQSFTTGTRIRLVVSCIIADVIDSIDANIQAIELVRSRTLGQLEARKSLLIERDLQLWSEIQRDFEHQFFFADLEGVSGAADTLTPLMAIMKFHEFGKHIDRCVSHANLKRAARNHRLASASGDTATMYAVANDYPNCLTLLLADGEEDVSAVDIDRWNALMIASSYGRADFVARLLQSDPRSQVTAANSDGLNALMIASMNGHEAVVVSLLGHHAETQMMAIDPLGRTALMLAVVAGHNHIVETLLRHDPRTQLIASSRRDVTPLIQAIYQDRATIVETLLRHESTMQVTTLSQDGVSALTVAIGMRRLELIDTLLLHHPEKQLLTATGGEIPLMMACSEGGVDIVERLLRHHALAQISAVDGRGGNALMRAIIGGHPSVAECLLRHYPKIQVAATTSEGITSLLLASLFGQTEIVSHILRVEPSALRQTDDKGRTALDHAIGAGELETARLLREHLAR